MIYILFCLYHKFSSRFILFHSRIFVNLRRIKLFVKKILVFWLMHFFYIYFFCYSDTHRLYSSSNTLNDVRETPPTLSSSSAPLNATNNRTFDNDEVLDPSGLNNVEFIKLKKVLVQPMHDVDVLYEPKTLDSSELGTGKNVFTLLIYECMINLVLNGPFSE